MRGFVLTGFGGLDKLEPRDDLPDPHPGPGEVVVQVAAAGLNNTDIWTREGAYGSSEDAGTLAGWSGSPLTFPRIQGADVTGHIVETGPGVRGARAGERVLVDPVLYTGDERALVTPRYLGSEVDGGYAELVTVPATNAHPIDSPLRGEELATFPTAYLTALRMLGRARVREGETVLVTGASGGVGSALVQLCAVRGANVVALTSAKKAREVAAIGAHAVLIRERFDPTEFTNGVDIVADVVGGDLFGRLTGEVLRPLGRYVTAGAIGGPVVETDLRRIYLKQIELIGSSFGSHEDFSELVDLIQDGSLRPLLARAYPLTDLIAAQKEFMAKNFIGNLVVVP